MSEYALKWLASVSVRFRPKSADTLEKVLDFTESFEQLPEHERNDLVASVSDEVAKKLFAFSAFLTELALTTSETRWVKGAIILHIVEDFRKDYRENFRFSVLAAYAANNIKANLNEIIYGAEKLASNRTKGYLNEFTRRDQDLNELNKFGVEIKIIDNQPRFIQM